MHPLTSYPRDRVRRRPRHAPRPGSFAALLAAILLTASGCHRGGAAGRGAAGAPADGGAAVPLAESRVTIRRSGGIAGIETEATVDGARLTYAIVTRRICESSVSCPTPTDAATGPIDAADARALFARIDQEGVFDLKDDYGISPTLRDGFVHELTLRLGERGKTVRADDATQPPQLARVEEEVMEAIRKARGR